MKHIDKKEPLADFSDFVKNEHPKNWDNIHHSKRHPSLYHDCRTMILTEEQGSLGGYTERPLQNSSNLHIDHFRKKGMNWKPDETFNWNNFIVEEINSNYGACYKDANTSNMADYNTLINPTVEYPEKMMTYLSNGEIIAKDNISENEKHKANFTIARFNLNHSGLRTERETLIKWVLNDYAALSDDEVREALYDRGYTTVVDWALMVRQIKYQVK